MSGISFSFCSIRRDSLLLQTYPLMSFNEPSMSHSFTHSQSHRSNLNNLESNPNPSVAFEKTRGWLAILFLLFSIIISVLVQLGSWLENISYAGSRFQMVKCLDLVARNKVRKKFEKYGILSWEASMKMYKH
ncbi:unnamed protein product [Vicia faba]|uniref:Uncharacterized protein n=1 Tax=Vicia faba TaxID=3906 RepID=A0AAV1B4K2_VICFA|nr:unnamed protein product [Vicia faba]